ncbi:MAG: NAD(+)/NADH kinase [Oscillospiraceae bacterium]|jgi:NAD+ kinase|nr:NAD(+)/NADH kinase [Oscillospiraceae bacterium]
MKIAVLPNLSKYDSCEQTKKAIKILENLNVEIFLLSECREKFKNKNVVFCENIEEAIRKTDLSVTIGGDGTIIYAAKYAALAGKPILGINLGRVGFVANLEKDKIFKLQCLAQNKYHISKRMMICANVCKKDNQEESSKDTFYSLNDVVISHSKVAKLCDFQIQYKNKDFFFRSDSLIFSTPTGSTAYSFSAGGPVVDPKTSCIILSQACPYSNFTRSIIFSKDSELIVKNASYKKQSNFFLIVDGEIKCKVTSLELVKIKVSPISVQLIHLEDQNFYDVFEKKSSQSQN